MAWGEALLQEAGVKKVSILSQEAGVRLLIIAIRAVCDLGVLGPSHQVRRTCQRRGAQIKTMEEVGKKVELKKQKEEKIEEVEEKENVMKRTS